MEKQEENRIISGQATPEQIAMWKKRYGKVVEVKVDDKVCYLHRPDRKTISAAITLGQSDPMRYNEVMLENCWISGDAEMKTNDEYFFAVVDVMDQLIAFKTAEIKNL